MYVTLYRFKYYTKASRLKFVLTLSKYQNYNKYECVMILILKLTKIEKNGKYMNIGLCDL